MYTVYEIRNMINDKTYVGVHKTDNPHDSYFGSGKAIKAAIKKYGKNNFVKNILHITEDKEEAYRIEKELTENFNLSSNYNMRLGGVGGFTPENARKGHVARSKLGGAACRDKKLGIHSMSSEQLSAAGRKGGLALKGKPKSPEHVAKIKETKRLKRP